MKFIQVGNSHIRNEESFIRGCLLFNIEYQKVNDICEVNGYCPDLIWAVTTWIDPNTFPKSRFLFGPQFFVFPNKNGPLVICESPGIEGRCFYNCLSEWNVKIHNVFAANPKIPYICLPYGIDTKNLRPNSLIHKKDSILIYWKDRQTYDLQFVIHILREHGLNYKIIKYGTYDINHYHSILQETKLCIWLGRHESQGFAFQEALSFNVPLLVYDVVDMKEEVDINNNSSYSSYNIALPASSAAYWDPICGEKTSDKYELIKLLQKMLGNLKMYRPREFIERELSDKACFTRLLNTFQLNIPKIDIEIAT